jgi:hypothetical protein
MTQLPGVPNSRDVIPGMAHFAGTGPTGTYCFQCSYFWNGSERSAGECREFMRLCPRKIHESEKEAEGASHSAAHTKLPIFQGAPPCPGKLNPNPTPRSSSPSPP